MTKSELEARKETVPIYKKYALTIDEAALYYNIGQRKLRDLAQRNKDAEYILWINSKVLIKRKKFSQHLDSQNAL